MSSLNSPSILRHFGYWTLHCSVNSITSFLIAGMYLNLFSHASAVFAMLAAIFTFVLLYTAFTGVILQKIQPHPIMLRALRIGVGIRVAVSLVSLIAMLPICILSPDFWAGMLAVNLYAHIASLLGLPAWDATASGAAVGNFFPIYCVTIIEGLILSITLFMFSFFAVLIIQSRERRKIYAQETTR